MKKDFSGNKGEWSEPYVVLRLLADGKLCQANKDLLPSPDEFSHVLEVIRGDFVATVQNGGIVAFSHINQQGERHIVQRRSDDLCKQANRLLKSICSVKNVKGAFELPTEKSDLCLYGFKRLTNPAYNGLKCTKRDLQLKLNGLKTGLATLGFSVKSELGAPPTLLNASESTNIIYRVKGLNSQQADSINKMFNSRKIMERCRAIRQQAHSIEYDSYYSKTFADNLEVVDSGLPKMLADLVKVYYFDQILLSRPVKRRGFFRESDKLSTAVELLSKTEPYASKSRKNFCEIKIKRFLRACALGLMPSEVWNGIDDASGGYIIVLPDGKLVALYVYNTSLFEQYLYESTIFERASMKRHKYMNLEPDNKGDYLLKLNLQIRFNR